MKVTAILLAIFAVFLMDSVGGDSGSGIATKDAEMKVEKEREGEGGKYVDVLFYNVCEGARGQEERAALTRFINEEVKVARDRGREIVIGLSELNGWTEEAFRAWVAQHSWGLHVCFLRTRTGYHLGAMSSSDMSEISRVTGDDGVQLHHGAIFFSTAGTRFALTHLNPHDARAREAEANFILRWRQTDVVFGDLNTIARSDADENLEHALLEGTSQLRKKFFLYRNGAYDLHHGVVDAFLKAGFYDSGLGATVPTKASTDKMHATPMRLDYILLRDQGSLSPRVVEPCRAVMRNYLLSDHYPVALRFSFAGYSHTDDL
eukprot:g3043.t1